MNNPRFTAAHVAFFLILQALALLPLSAQPHIRLRDVAVGLHIPWDMVWGPDDQLWITEHPGIISRVNPETGAVHRLRDLRGIVHEAAEAGMLALHLDPSFPDSPYVYVVYTWRSRDSTVERLSRFTWDPEVDSMIAERVLLDSIRGADFRNGSRLLEGPGRTLFMSTGDASQRWRAQDPRSLNGKILRIGLDGSVPVDNPWASAPWPSSLIWSLGHRNPQGLCRGPNGIIYESEHGENDDDEINIIVPTWNYGWPNVHGFCDDTVNFKYDSSERQYCRDSQVVEPIRGWTPTIGPGSLLWYASGRIPLLTNSLLMVTLGKLKPDLPPYSYSLVRLRMSADGSRVLHDTALFSRELGRLRGICASPDGRIFLSTSNRDGRASDSLGFPREGDDRIVEIDWQTSEALSDALATGTVSVIPHPLYDRTTIALPTAFGVGTWRLYDSEGRIVVMGGFDGGDRIELRRGDLSPGAFTMFVTDGVRRSSVRLLVGW